MDMLNILNVEDIIYMSYEVFKLYVDKKLIEFC